MTQTCDLDGVTLAYDVVGEGEPVVLLAGCGAPAAAFHLELAPALVAGGYQVLTYDHRGMPPSSAPPAPYRVEDLVSDLVGLLDHLGMARVRLAGHSMGGWVAEALAAEDPGRVGAAALMGSANRSTSWERVSTGAQRDLAALGVELSPRVGAVDVLHYLTDSELQDDEVVDGWLSMLEGAEPWGNPGRLGQLEACLAWSNDPRRPQRWGTIEVPCLVLAFEHDIDSPPARAKEAARAIPGARFSVVAGATHLGPLTHAGAVAAELLAFFAGS